MYVTAPWKQELAGAKLLKQGSPSMIPCGSGDTNGVLFQQILLPEDGTVLGVRHSKMTNGRSSADACIFVRVRSDGGNIRIHGKVPRARNTALPPEVLAFSGKGDILTYNDMAMLGLSVPKNFRFLFMEQEEVEECFSWEVDDSGTRKTFTQETVDVGGEKRTILVETPARRIRVRRT